MLRRTIAVVVLAVAGGACAGGESIDISHIPELPAVDTADVEARLAASELPVVLNVWASWCVPCRSEAPLLADAATANEGRVAFLGLDVRDDQNGARRFIAEFLDGVPMEHLFDQPGDIPVDLGASRAVPMTFFFAPGGDLVDRHLGILTEERLAEGIDALLATG